MTKARKSRSARRKLKAHQRGDDRHSKSVQFLNKRDRLRAEHRQRPLVLT